MNLSDRMKKYENVSRYHLTRRTPIIVRVDGRAFHTLLKKANKPFDRTIITAMMMAAKYLFKEMQGCKLAYVQSDEASFVLTDYDDTDTQGWFDYNTSKIISISASIMSVMFNYFWWNGNLRQDLPIRVGFFDSRVFNIPKEDVANYFLWRARDWKRNSLSMYARSFFSHKELLNKNSSDIHEMLHTKGKNWATDLDDTLKNGSWLVKGSDEIGWRWRHDIRPVYADISEIVDPLIELKK